MGYIRQFDDDICWCYNSADGENGCEFVDCFRHVIHMPKREDGERYIYTIGELKGTDYCPHQEEMQYDSN